MKKISLILGTLCLGLTLSAQPGTVGTRPANDPSGKLLTMEETILARELAPQNLYCSWLNENEILMHLRKTSNMKTEISIDEPLNVDWDGNELLLKVPGFHPMGSVSRATLKNGIYTEKSGLRRSYDASPFDCRIYYDRTDGLKLKEKAPAGGELVCNGSFDKADAKNPAIPADHHFVANKNYYAEYLKTAGVNGSVDAFFF